MSGVLLDFAGTLFEEESIEDNLRAIGVPDADQPALAAAISRAFTLTASPDSLPPDLARTWTRRDLSAAEHRAAFTGVMCLGGVAR